MQSRAIKIASVLLGLLFVIGIVWLIYLTTTALWRQITALDSEVAVAIIAATATAFVSVVGVVITKLYESRETINKAHRDKKTPVYEDLLNFLSRIQRGIKTEQPPQDGELMDFIFSFTPRIMIWGADDVLAAWIKWIRLAGVAADDKSKAADVMFEYENLILKIRKDLGHKNQGIKKGDVLSLFINDIDKYVTRK